MTGCRFTRIGTLSGLALVVLLAGLGIVTVVLKLSRLLGDEASYALTFTHGVTQAWWEGIGVYTLHRGGVVQPPTTWVVLWPLFAWAPLNAARWMWALATLAALAALGAACARAVRAGGLLARRCALVAPFSMPALADAVGFGGLIAMLLPAAIWAIILAARTQPTWKSDLAAAGLFDIALADPTFTVPFLGTLFAAPLRRRPAALAIAGYAILLVAAAYLHPGSLVTDIRLWIQHLQGQAGAGYGNIQGWLFASDRLSAFAPVSLLLLAIVYAFAWQYRRADLWLLLGVSAIAARLWIAQRIDADGLLIIPLIAVARMTLTPTSCSLARWYRLVLIVSAVVLWVPLQFHFVGSTIGPIVVTPSWVRVFNLAHTGVVLLLMIVLLSGSRKSGVYGDARSETASS